MVVHTVEDALCHVLVLVADECQCARLGEAVLLVAYFVVDGQRVGIGRVVHHAYSSHLEHVVDVLYVAGHLLIGLGELRQVLLLAVVAVGHLGDVAPRAVDAQQPVVLVVDGHQL